MSMSSFFMSTIYSGKRKIFSPKMKSSDGKWLMPCVPKYDKHTPILKFNQTICATEITEKCLIIYKLR